MAVRRSIWVTRSQPGADATARRLAVMGFEPIVAPLLEIRPIPGVRIDLAGVAALAFTSANGVHAFAQRSSERALKVFAVGAATARAARDAGFRNVLSTDGDVNALAAGIATRARDLAGGAVLHPGALQPAGDLAGALVESQVEVRAIALYDAGPADIPQTVLDAIGALWAVLVYSPNGARALAALLKTHPAPDLRAFCLSKAVAQPLARARIQRLTPPAPNDEALLALAEATAAQA